MQVRERHFGGRDQEQIPVAGDLEQILLELRQVARAGERRAVDEERRLDLAVAVLARVQVEHEVDERAREPRAGAEQHREARARHARRALEVENAERGAELPVRLRREVERRRRAPACAPRRCRPPTCPPARSRAADSGSVSSSASRCASTSASSASCALISRAARLVLREDRARILARPSSRARPPRPPRSARA